ncbi:La-related protein 6 [Bagarius yarrelli]|uniref:La-related protein 6 n=1 Tax=Bagarius yarrelli TaxID=175774 RepID=A0A556TQK9_BAGYA|nr:La-related protein 6 [Bagarius yarrelli]
MQVLVNAFLRFLSFLLPPSWLQLAFRWWVGGDECGGSPWPNRGASLAHRKPLIANEEVTARGDSRPPGCVSLSAAPAPSPSAAVTAPPPLPPPLPLAEPADGRGFPWRRVREAVELVLAAPFVISERQCRKTHSSSCNHLGGVDEDIEAPSRARWSATVMSAATELPNTLEVVGATAGFADHRLHEMGTPVTITVAIQAAEDEEPDEEETINSEDEILRHEKSSGAGTSGGELEEESWQPPDPELTQKLISQIEYYLSDENLEHDAFLLKHVRRNKLGFVSVKLLTSFKKVKHLTRDWRTTAYALRHSTLLELNEEGRKVRRRTSVPVFASESLPSRMLLLSELQRWPELGVALAGGGGAGDGSPGANPAQQERLMELLLKAFGVYGPIASVRVLKPGKDLPPDLKKLSGRYSQLGTEECAIVEFEEVEAAVKAHEAYSGQQGDGNGSMGLKVVLIGTKPPKKKVPKDRQREENGNAGGEGLRKSRSLNSRVRELQYHGDDSACSSSETESNPTSPRLGRKSRSCNKLSPGGFHLSPAVSPRSSPWNSPRASPCAQRKAPPNARSPLASEGRLSPEAGRRWADYSSDSSLTPSGSPWVQRRKQVASQESSPVGSPMLGRKIQNADGLPPGVVRLPRGPDGTRGFHAVLVAERGKTAATQT